MTRLSAVPLRDVLAVAAVKLAGCVDFVALQLVVERCDAVQRHVR